MEELHMGFEKSQVFAKRLAQAGGKVVPGSDTVGNIPGLGIIFEMQSLVDAGLTPMQAIMGATKWSAEMLHKEKDLGTVEAGKLADIIVVEGNPLEDITTLTNTRVVILEGKVMDTTLDPNFRDPLPRTVYADGLLELSGPEIVPSGITPKMAREGDAGVALEISGKNFNPRSVARFDTTDLQTQFVSESKLTATVPRANLQKVGTYAISVVNPGSGGSTSNAAFFLVNFKD